MSNLATKLKAPELELPKDFDCALDFDFSPDKFWTIQSELQYLGGIVCSLNDELASHCVQEEERVHKDESKWTAENS